MQAGQAKAEVGHTADCYQTVASVEEEPEATGTAEAQEETGEEAREREHEEPYEQATE